MDTLHEIDRLTAENARLKAELARVQADYSLLTGERFSDRCHTALKSRAEKAEAEVARLQGAVPCDESGCPILARHCAVCIHPEIAAAQQARAEKAEAEVARLRECLRIAGLQAFMRDKPPGEVAEHLRSVIESHVTAADKAEAEVGRLRRVLEEISRWREDAWNYDDDMDHELRFFSDEEEWDMIEKYARLAVEVSGKTTGCVAAQGRG